ncbi:MAG TPA: aconitase family protein [Bacteroidales bacterium]
MGMTMIEKILARHSVQDVIKPGEIVDLNIDLRVARDQGGANVIRQIQENKLTVDAPEKTFFTLDSNTSNDKHYTENLHLCKTFAREQGIRVFDVHEGIGTHLMIDNGFAVPGSTLISSDPQANLLGAIGALGQGMGDKDITNAFHKGKIWYRVPKTIRINLQGVLDKGITAKDLVFNLYSIFGANKLLGYAVELSGPTIDLFSLDARITLASMASELGAITFLMTPNQEVIDYCSSKSQRDFEIIEPDENAEYEDDLNIDVSKFLPMIAKPGSPFDLVPLSKIQNIGIDSAFIGTSANGRIEDLRVAAGILKNRKVSPGVVLKIMPATDSIWTQSLQEGLIDIFKEAGAIVSNAGSSEGNGDVMKLQGYGEIAVSTGTKNYKELVGHGDIYLASPLVVAASAVAGFITAPGNIPDAPDKLFWFPRKETSTSEEESKSDFIGEKPTILKGKVWYIPFDNIDTDMIYHSRYEEITEKEAIANHTFSHLLGYEDFASKVIEGDIVVTGENFGLGNSRQQAVDCFKALGIQAIVAKSFAVIYERNAINAGLPIIACTHIDNLKLQTGDTLIINLDTGEIINDRNHITVTSEKFSNIQMEIYQRGGLFNV